jgi:antitoxin component YwqK of YwqJK toxin-antitoxin module
MKKYTILFIFVLVAILFSCETTQKDKKGEKIKDGIGKIYWKDGSVKGTGTFKNYQQEGKWTLFHQGTGEKLAEGNYLGGKQEGKWVFYHKNGQKSAEGSFQEDQKVGEWIRYYDTGEVFSKENYVITEVEVAGFKQKIGGIEGIKQTFYTSGKVKSEEEFRKGLKNGISREFYEDGKPKEFSEYKENKYNGKVNKFWPNGKPKEQSYYVNGMRNGTLKAFHNNGVQHIEGQFNNGLMTGLWKYYSTDRKLQKEGNYMIQKFGSGAKAKMTSKESGFWTFYAYVGGRKMKAMELTLNGGMIQGPCRLYINGKLAGEGEMTGIPKAVYDVYKDNKQAGTIEAGEVPPDDITKNVIYKWTGAWRQPKRNGRWIEFYTDSRAKKFEANFMMDKINGKYTEYYPDGKVKATGEYMNDKKNGLWKFYNRDGSLDTAKSGRYMLDKKSKF